MGIDPASVGDLLGEGTSIFTPANIKLNLSCHRTAPKTVHEM